MAVKDTSMRETLVTRIPIFDKTKEVFAYELLFKTDFSQNLATKGRNTRDTGSSAPMEAVDGFMVNGLKILSSGKKVFVNFNWEMLLTEMAFIFPNNLLGVGIGQKPDPEKKVLKAAKKLKDAGYTLMLGDEAVESGDCGLCSLADIIGGDFRRFNLEQQTATIESSKDKAIKFLAKSVETATDYGDAEEKGYEYFQGSFFSKADLVPVRNIPSHKLNFLRILKEINKPKVQFDQIEKILKKDVSITYKLLRFINSANFGFKSSVQSIHHALTLLGEMEVRKWLSLIILSGTGTNKPEELIKNTIIRAKFCEAVAAQIKQVKEKDLQRFFLLGMFSMVDAFLDRPMDEIMTELPLESNIKAALLGDEDNRYRQVLDVIVDYEQGDWQNFSDSAKKLNLDEQKIAALYLESVDWAA